MSIRPSHFVGTQGASMRAVWGSTESFISHSLPSRIKPAENTGIDRPSGNRRSHWHVGENLNRLAGNDLANICTRNLQCVCQRPERVRHISQILGVPDAVFQAPDDASRE